MSGARYPNHIIDTSSPFYSHSLALTPAKHTHRALPPTTRHNTQRPRMRHHIVIMSRAMAPWLGLGGIPSGVPVGNRLDLDERSFAEGVRHEPRRRLISPLAGGRRRPRRAHPVMVLLMPELE